MDPSYLWRWPLLWLRIWVRWLGWKWVLVGMAGGLVLAVVLNYKT
jgi:hypothetical protein